MKAIYTTACLFVAVTLGLFGNNHETKSHFISTTKMYKKPGLPVDIKYPKVYISKSQQTTLPITLFSAKHIQSMDVDFYAKDLTLNHTTQHLHYTIYPAQTSNQHTFNITIKPHKEGIVYLYMRITDTKQMVRAFAIPIYVGEQAVTLRAKSQSTTQGIQSYRGIETRTIKQP